MTYAWVAYLGAAIIGEIALAFAPVATGLIDAAVLVLALSHFGWAQRLPIAIGDPSIRLLPAVALIPLMRLLSLTLPVPDFPPLTWLAIVGGPLLLAVLASARLARLDVGQLGLARVSRNPLSILVVIGSIPTGVLVGWLSPFQFGSPMDSPLAAGLVASVLVGAAAIPEELIFRGLLLQLLNNRIGGASTIVGALVFAATYVGAESPGILAVMAVTGVAYGLEVRRSRSMWAPIVGHSVLVLSAAFLAPALAA